MSYTNILNTYRGKIGKIGEDYACEYLVDKGHIIIERNYRNKVGEIDIITKYKSRIHIVEVKTTNSTLVRAEENMNFAKIKKVSKLAEIYMKSVNNGKNDSRETVFCIDFIGVNLNVDLSLKKIIHLENIEI